MARHTLVASVGAAKTPAQNQPHPPRRSDKLFSYRKLLASSVSFRPENIQGMNAVNRSCSSKTPGDFSQSTKPSTSAARRWSFPTLHLLRKIDQTQHEWLMAFSAPWALHIAAESCKAQNGRKKSEIHKKTKTSPQATAGGMSRRLASV